jgi:hypothetical protein
MSTNIYLITISLPFLTVLIVFGMKYASEAFAARARLANDGAYQALAEKAASAQAQNQASLASIQADLTKLTASLAAVQTILAQVE